MSKTKDKAEILAVIRDALLNYEELIGQTFLYVFDNRCIEVLFRRKEFIHLAGIDTYTKMGAEQLYKNIKKGILKPNQICFSNRHPYDLCKKKIRYDLCKKKIRYLSNISQLTFSNVLILENLETNTFTYMFGLTDLNFTLCLSEDYNENGILRSNYYIARSLRAENATNKSENSFEIDFILSKRNDEGKYKDILYESKNCSIEDLSVDILKKIEPDMYKK